MKTNKQLIDLFGVVVKEVNNLSQEQIQILRTRAAQLGYIIHPDCYNKTVLSWIMDKDLNLNATFYKNWGDITSRSRWELYIDQTISYIQNYCLNGNFDMNDNDYTAVPDIRKYKLIIPITKEDMLIKCENLLSHNIALNTNTISIVCSYIIKNYNKKTFNIDTVKVKEAQVVLCDALNILPKDKFNLLRYMVYKSTGSSELIKSDQMLSKIRMGKPFLLNSLKETDLINLASIFYRFKPIFLAFKHQTRINKPIINEIRRLAKKYHQPMRIGFWESIVNTPMPINKLKERLIIDKPSNFKLITLIQTIRENRILIGSSTRYKMYKIRNNNVWIDNMDTPPALDLKYDWWDDLEEILYKELVERLKKKACTVKFHPTLKLACPTSEKNFIGNIPFGSFYNMLNHNMVGIYWKEEWGTRDFDLSFISYDGYKYGWNSRYYDHQSLELADIIYSGDMTRANPEASEVIYIRQNCPNGIFKVNRYSGSSDSKYILTISQSEVQELPRNYMVDPNTIDFQTEIYSSSKTEQIVGFVIDKKLYISNIDFGNMRVSNKFGTKEMIDILMRKNASRIDLEQLLLDAGFKPMKRGSKTNPIQLDLTDLNKDTLIGLIS